MSGYGDFPGVKVTTKAGGDVYGDYDQSTLAVHYSEVDNVTDEQLSGSIVYFFDDDITQEVVKFTANKAQEYVRCTAYSLHESWKDRELTGSFEPYIYAASFGTIDVVHRSDGSIIDINPDVWNEGVPMSTYLNHDE